jgi:hypothetical protein
VSRYGALESLSGARAESKRGSLASRAPSPAGI